MIGAFPMPESKTKINLASKISAVCEEWGITPRKVIAAVTDNGANIVAACQAVFGEAKHLACFAHKINLVASTALGLTSRNGDEDEPLPLPPDGQESGDDEDEVESGTTIPTEGTSELITTKSVLTKVKKIVRFFRNSERASEELKTLQKQPRPGETGQKADSQCLKLVQQVVTRWNSTFYMLDRFLELLEFVERALTKVAREKTSKAVPPPMLTITEEEVAREIRDLLRPLAEVTKEISSEKNVTVSKVIPLYHCMVKVGTGT